MTPTIILSEITITTLIYLFAIYYALFSYRVEWSGMVGVIVISSIVTAYLNRFLLLTTPIGKTNEGEMITVIIGILALYILSYLAVLVMLVYRFDFAIGVGLSLLSGMILYLFKRFRA